VTLYVSTQIKTHIHAHLLLLAFHSKPFSNVALHVSMQIKSHTIFHVNACTRPCLYMCVCVILTASLAFPVHTIVAYLIFDSTMVDRVVEVLLSYHSLTGIYISQDSFSIDVYFDVL